MEGKWKGLGQKKGLGHCKSAAHVAREEMQGEEGVHRPQNWRVQQLRRGCRRKMLHRKTASRRLQTSNASQ